MDPELRRLLASRDIPCPGCGYNLRGMTRPACPECGSEITPRRVEHGIIATRSREQRLAAGRRLFSASCLLLMGSLLLCAAILALGVARFTPAQRPPIILVLLVLAAGAGLLRAWTVRTARNNPQRADRVIKHTQGPVGLLTLIALIPLIMGGLGLVLGLIK